MLTLDFVCLYRYGRFANRHTLLKHPRKATRDFIVHQILDILLEMKPGGVAEQVIPEKSRLIELEVQYNGLYISGKTIATTKNVVYGERSGGTFD